MLFIQFSWFAHLWSQASRQFCIMDSIYVFFKDVPFFSSSSTCLILCILAIIDRSNRFYSNPFQSLSVPGHSTLPYSSFCSPFCPGGILLSRIFQETFAQYSSKVYNLSQGISWILGHSYRRKVGTSIFARILWTASFRVLISEFFPQEIGIDFCHYEYLQGLGKAFQIPSL